MDTTGRHDTLNLPSPLGYSPASDDQISNIVHQQSRTSSMESTLFPNHARFRGFLSLTAGELRDRLSEHQLSTAGYRPAMLARLFLALLSWESSEASIMLERERLVQSLVKMGVADLRDELRERQLPETGKKLNLLIALVAYYKSIDEDEEGSEEHPMPLGSVASATEAGLEGEMEYVCPSFLLCHGLSEVAL